jgi:uncharacterized membrane protein
LFFLKNNLPFAILNIALFLFTGYTLFNSIKKRNKLIVAAFIATLTHTYIILGMLDFIVSCPLNRP